MISCVSEISRDRIWNLTTSLSPFKQTEVEKFLQWLKSYKALATPGLLRHPVQMNRYAWPVSGIEKIQSESHMWRPWTNLVTPITFFNVGYN